MKEIKWENEKPFKSDKIKYNRNIEEELNLENELHIDWIYTNSLEYAKNNNIEGVTKQFTIGF